MGDVCFFVCYFLLFFVIFFFFFFLIYINIVKEASKNPIFEFGVAALNNKPSDAPQKLTHIKAVRVMKNFSASGCKPTYKKKKENDFDWFFFFFFLFLLTRKYTIVVLIILS